MQERTDFRILICRLSHIGDCVLTLPMVNELRRAFPNSHITWAMESPTNKLLGSHAAIDEVLLVPRGWMKQLSTIRMLHRVFRARKFEIAIDPQSILKSALLARLSGASQRFGFSGKHGREKSNWINNRLVAPRSTHLVDRSLDLIRPLVPDVRFQGFDLPLPTEALLMAREFRERQVAGQRMVIINPGASWRSKQWVNSRFGELAALLANSPDVVPVVTWAGETESSMADEIVRISQGRAIKAPPTSLRELAAFLKLSALFIGCDTGPMHIAAAVGTKCIGLYGPTRPEDSGAYGPQHVAIQVRYQGGGSRERRCASNDAMREITTRMVADAAIEALNQARECRKGLSAA